MTDASPAYRSDGSGVPQLGRVADIVKIGNRSGDVEVMLLK